MPVFLPPALIFFCNSVLFISLFTRLPSIQQDMGIDKAALGLALLGAPVGTLVALPLAGRVAEWLTPRRTIIAMLTALSILTPCLSILSYPGFVLGLVLLGFIRTLLDVSQNLVCSGIEQESGRKILARSHGFWSIGLLIGTSASGWVAGQGMSPFQHLCLAAVFVLVVGWFAFFSMPKTAGQALATAGRRASIFVLPNLPVILIALMLFGLAIIEGAIYDWGMFLIREQFTPDAWLSGLLYACFTIGMGITRLCGDKLREYVPARRLIRGSAVLVAIGLGLLVTSQNLHVAAFALFLIGCGIALNYPLAAAALFALKGERSSADNMAALTFVMLVSTIGIPPLLGIVAEEFGIVRSFQILLPLTLLTYLMARVADGWTPRRLRSAKG